MVALAERRLAPAVFLGWQSGCGVRPDFALFNLRAEIAGHPRGSTVSAETLEAAGFRVPELVAVRPHPAGGYTHAVQQSASCSIYRGNWPTRSAARAAIQFFHAQEATG